MPKAKGFFPTEKAVLYGALSTEEGPGKPSAIGVLAYYIPDMEKTLAVLWGDPNRSETPSTNYWNIRLYDGEKPANFEMFSDLHNHDPIVSYETQHKDLGSGLKVIGSISKTDLTTLGIHVRKVE